MISRFKFNDNFIDYEDHWDKDPFGTAKPIKLIEKAPNLTEDLLINYLNNLINNDS